MSQFNRQNRFIFRQRRPQSLLGQIVTFVVGVGILAVSFVFGAFLLTAVFGLFLLIVLIALVRGWWLRRQMTGAAKQGPAGSSDGSHEVIDGDFTVVDSGHKRRNDDDQHHDAK